MNKKYIGSFLASLAITLFASTGCFAESWGGRDDLSAGGAAGTGGSAGKHSTIWAHYKFLGTPGTQGKSIKITPQWNNGDKAPQVSGTCAAPGVGFWLLANASDTSFSEPGKCVTNNTNNRNNVATALGVSAESLGSEWFYRSEIGCNSAKKSDGSYTTYLPIHDNGEINEGNFYINQHSSGWAAYDTLSANNVGSYSNVNYTSTTVAGQKYYFETKAVYENDKIATSFDDVAKDFKVFSRIDSVSNDLEDSASLDAVWNQMKSEKIYAFCSFNNEYKTELESKSEIELYQGGAKKTEKISDGWGKTSTAGEIELDNNSDIVLKYRFAYRRGEDTKFATSSIAKDSTITVYRSGGSNYVSTSATTPGFNIGLRELSVMHENIGHKDEGGVKVSLAGLAINTPYTFCATISHSSQLTVSGSNTVGSGSANSGACVVIKIKPPVTAEVDSDTLAMISSSKLAPGYTKTTFSSHEAGGADKSIEFTGSNAAKVIPGDMTIDWAHYMGYRDLSDASTTVKSIYGLNNGGLTRSTTLGTYSNPSIPNGYNLEKITTKTGVFPGETRAYVYSIQHPSRVDVLTGQRASDAGPDETSSVKLGLYAEPVTCGLDDLHSYPIGVDNPYDYRWLSLSRTSSEYNHNISTLTLGDGLSDNGEMWLTPTDKIMTNQVACFGSQIAEDASYEEADRFSKNRWVNETVDNRETDTVHNRQFTLVTELPEALFTGNKLANRTGSHTKQSFRASEIGVTNFSNVSTPQSRIDARYELRAPSASDIMIDGKKENIGKSLTTTFRKPTQDGGINGPAVTMVAKIPYNYSLKLGLNGEADADTNILDSDDASAFEGVVTSTGRVNKLVCAGHKDADPTGSCDGYVTRTRGTQASMLIFTMNANFSHSNLENNNEFSVNGSKLDESDLKTAISNHYGADYVDNPSINYEHSGNSVVIDASDSFAALNITLGPTSVNPTDYAVGTKICAVLAAYPSDSHNTGDGRAIEIGENQDAAFDGYGGELKTKYKVSCRTVAKRQTMSVEGNGVVSTGAINSSQSKYGGRVFKSWSEYQVVAGTVAPVKTAVSSGAVTAYDMASPAKDVNVVKDNISNYSVPYNWFQYPQSLGSYSTSSKPRSAEEATANWGYSEKLINTIKKKYGEKATDVGNINLTQAIVNQDVKNTITIRSSGTITITENLYIPSGSERLIIIAKNIYIDRDVTEVNAWLIVDGEDVKNAGEFNTCAGYNINDEDYSDDDKHYGNSHILQDCNKALLINGPVIIKTSTERDSGKYKPVQFPRTYGGGSRFNESGQIERDEKSFAQRAEIFNYDPSVVEWAYNESKKDPQIVTTYTETLAPRL